MAYGATLYPSHLLF
ncbi:hypothetical protein EQP49_04965 [Yersinia sp. 2105 StPb PI]|nr:hypothetical protein EQP49_04965 [Yersinia sp. 2105 StPb PI]